MTKPKLLDLSNSISFIMCTYSIFHKEAAIKTMCIWSEALQLSIQVALGLIPTFGNNLFVGDLIMKQVLWSFSFFG